MEIGKWF